MITPAPSTSGTAFAYGDEETDERFDGDPEE
jgi:hypothetical protein